MKPFIGKEISSAAAGYRNIASVVMESLKTEQDGNSIRASLSLKEMCVALGVMPKQAWGPRWMPRSLWGGIEDQSGNVTGLLASRLLSNEAERNSVMGIMVYNLILQFCTSKVEQQCSATK
jgi:hypothetical protein